MFIDKVKLHIKSGNGGNGLASFRREKYVPKGGPYGGDGGDGGHIIFVADSHKSTLLDLRYQHHLKAQNGGDGKNKKMHGAKGEDFIVKVPVGTVVKKLPENQIIADLLTVGQQAIIARGGKGGRGNVHFATAKNPAPKTAELGELGQEFDVEVELKLLADVGLIGYPSVGKSTLLAVVSKAKPEIGDYPFTTIIPNLGVVSVGDKRSFVLADMPGLIENASLGKGLGIQFLKHIERTRVLIHMVDMSDESQRDPIEDFRIINQELEQYQYQLLKRPMIVVASKMDLPGSLENLERFKKAYPQLDVFPIAAIKQEGLQPLLYKVAEVLETMSFDAFEVVSEVAEEVVFKFEPKDRGFEVERIDNTTWRLFGDKIKDAFRSVDNNDEDSIYRFSHQLSKLGVDEYMRKCGVKHGDTILLESTQFDFIDE